MGVNHASASQGPRFSPSQLKLPVHAEWEDLRDLISLFPFSFFPFGLCLSWTNWPLTPFGRQQFASRANRNFTIATGA